MSSAFADTHNMVAILTKSDASEGFDQIIDFLNGGYIKYALTINPHIYVSCIKQFWNTVTVKQSTDVTRLQALVDRKKVVISEVVIRDILRLDDAKGVDCLPHGDIFTGLARMGYEKPSPKLTFYKDFFSSQWKLLIHTILQSLSAKRTSWNEFSSAMASAVICLSTGRKFNFSMYIFDSLVRNIDSSSKFYMYPRFIQLILQNQLGDLSTHTTKYTSPALTQKVFANMRMVGKGFSGVETPLFEGLLVVRENVVEGIVVEQVQDDAVVAAAPEGVTATVEEDIQAQSIPSPSPPPQDLPSTSQMQHTPPSSPQPQPQAQPQAADFPLSLLQTTLDTCVALTSRIEQLESDKLRQALEITQLKKRVKRLGKGQKVKVFKLKRLKKGRMIGELDKDEGIELMGEKEEEKKTEQAKDIAYDDQVEGRQAEIYQIDMDHPSKVLSIQEDESAEVEEVVKVVTTAKLITEVNAASTPVSVVSITIPAVEPQVPAATPTVVPPKPMKKKDQVELDEEYARKLHEELNKDIDWDTAIDHVKLKAKEDPAVQRYQAMKKRPQTEAQARKNMMIFLKNTVGFRLDYFKGMSYDDIRPIFEAKFNTNIKFLLKSKEQIEEEENRAIEIINETPAQKAAKRRKLNEEVKDVEDLKQHLEIVPDEDDDVYTEATPLARKVFVVDYQIIQLNNKPRYKIIKADGTYQLYASFITLLKNFDREDLESLWSIVKERFSTSKPNNFSDDYLLTTLRAMFERPDGQDNVWKSQRSAHGQAMVKSLKLLTSSLELMLPWSIKKNTKCFNVAGEELSAVKHILMLLDTTAERRLFQQYVVPAFYAIEQNRIDYVRKHQNDIRIKYLFGIYDAINRGDIDGSDCRLRLILPQSCMSGPCYMYSHYLDALAICRVHGNPFFFIMFTLEFQKRLPHCHSLLWIHESVRVSREEDIDIYVSAELPSEDVDPECYSIVSEFMMHRPCGLACPSASCMHSSPWNGTNVSEPGASKKKKRPRIDSHSSLSLISTHKTTRLQVIPGDPFSTCKNHGPQPTPVYSYCFKAIINDGTATMSLTCFSDNTNTLIKDCDDILAELPDKDQYKLPFALKDLEGTTHVFQFHFNSGSSSRRRDLVLDRVFKSTVLPLPAPPP
uniref:DNA helicase n=1 Tax=Tanacetum cinerariifolium TaxID=118510 RepID=A0A6L2LJL2_TANCI|nr:DNA helicase [Tanacetum cinerariifolium]